MEILLFIAIFAIVASMIFPLLFSATENRLLQETVGLVEGNGHQILQKLSEEIRHAERILHPLPHETSSVLLLQTGSGGSNPTLFGTISGSFILVHREQQQTVSAGQVSVSDFRVRNTSVSPNRHSISLSFTISRTIRLEAPRQYVRTFQAQIPLYPTDAPKGSACSCPLPGCANANTFQWDVYSISSLGTCQCDLRSTYVLCW